MLTSFAIVIVVEVYRAQYVVHTVESVFHIYFIAFVVVVVVVRANYAPSNYTN